MNAALLSGDLSPGMGASQSFLRGRGTRCWRRPMDPATEAMCAAIEAARAALAGGRWKPRGDVCRIADAYGVRITPLIDRAGIAVSESGHYVCLVQTDTPEAAPDEIDDDGR
jgi:hypothetical protein